MWELISMIASSYSGAPITFKLSLGPSTPLQPHHLLHHVHHELPLPHHLLISPQQLLQNLVLTHWPGMLIVRLIVHPSSTVLHLVF